MRGERRTVLIALAANAIIAVSKALGGLATGSSAMLAETAHSLADTTDQVLMYHSIRLGEREPDEEHPFGYGKEQFFWTLLASVVMFLAGSIFALGYGILRLFESSNEQESYWLVYGALGFAFVAEGISFLRAFRQTRGEAQERGLPLVKFVRESKSPAVKMVFSEDSAALLGLLIAFGGTLAAQLTGDQAWDASASVAIGVLLVLVAVAILRDTKGLLIGEAAPAADRRRLKDVICRHDGIDGVLDLRTMYVGPHSLLVAARVDLADELPGERIEALATEIQRALKRELDDVDQVFLDPTGPEGRVKLSRQSR